MECCRILYRKTPLNCGNIEKAASAWGDNNKYAWLTNINLVCEYRKSLRHILDAVSAIMNGLHRMASERTRAVRSTCHSARQLDARLPSHPAPGHVIVESWRIGDDKLPTSPSLMIVGID